MTDAAPATNHDGVLIIVIICAVIFIFIWESGNLATSLGSAVSNYQAAVGTSSAATTTTTTAPSTSTVTVAAAAIAPAAVASASSSNPTAATSVG